jgi:aldehyde dehydrogenase (NAD+)
MPVLPDAKLYIDGAVRDAEGGKTFDVIGPWTGEVVGVAADASAADVEAAIAAARRAFDDTDWSTNIELRVALVTKLRALFEDNRVRRLPQALSRSDVGTRLWESTRLRV